MNFSQSDEKYKIHLNKYIWSNWEDFLDEKETLHLRLLFWNSDDIVEVVMKNTTHWAENLFL